MYIGLINTKMNFKKYFQRDHSSLALKWRYAISLRSEWLNCIPLLAITIFDVL